MADWVSAARAAGIGAAPDAVPAFTLAVWSAPISSWVSLAVSTDRRRIDALVKRFEEFLTFHVRVVETAADDDELIVAALSALRRPYRREPSEVPEGALLDSTPHYEGE